MRLTFASIVMICAIAVVPACAKNPPPVAATKPVTDEDKTFYALGQLISKNLDAFQLSPKELALVKAGLEDGVTGKASDVKIEEYGEKIQELHQKRQAALGEKEKAAGQEFLAKAAGEKGATKTATGLVITEITPGTGASPSATDEVKVHYEGKLTNGDIFDSSLQRGEPATFPLNGVIPCWTEALQLMKVGGKSRIVCPADLAYGERGSPPKIRSGATLVFEVQLLDIVKPEAAGAGPKAQ
jgi:FKBP-type peptidyl-prolyl cis-trans isomerase FkpA